MFNRPVLLWHTVRHLRFRQILGRISFMLKRRFLRAHFSRRIAETNVQKVHRIPTLPLRPVNPVVEEINLARQQFSFQIVSVTFNSDIVWNNLEQPLLWRYHLHYFDCLIPLAGNVTLENYHIAEKLLQNWIDNNPIGEGPGWEPYPLSLRIVNWIFWSSKNHEKLSQNADFEATFTQSLFHQAAFLSHYFEYHLQANHLFENCKALLIAGLCLNHPDWTKRGWRELRREMDEQILPDGTHYERSPSYHSIILCGLLDVLNVLQQVDAERCSEFIQSEARTYLEKKCRSMLSSLNTFTHPDGNLALFGDTAFDTQLTYEQLSDYAKQLGIFADNTKLQPQLPDAGFAVLKNEQQYLILDTGPIGVRHQPGHAHADLLIYVYSFWGKRIVVDSVVGEYLPTNRRQQARSIAAHNTVFIKGLEQMEAWGAFRVGRWIHESSIKPVETTASSVSSAL